MKILVLSFYYPPDLSAGSFRVIGLVKSLLASVERDIQVEVITTYPNRYHGFVTKINNNENCANLKIHRIRVPAHNSRMLDQVKSFILYASEVQKIIKNEQYDLIFSTSSRLMTAALGAWISKLKKIPLYLDIRDIFVDTIKDVLPKKFAFFLTPIFLLIEQFTISQAVHVNLVSPGFEKYFKNRYPKKTISFFMNGVDEEFCLYNFLMKKENSKKSLDKHVIRILYAGNIGEGQGLHKIIPMLAKELGDRVVIKVIGGGGKLSELQSSLRLININNVELVPAMDRTELIKEYEKADVLFLHLNNYDAFEKVLPSKIFEYAALGKPILGGVSGYAAQFLSQEVDNSAVFPPCDFRGAVKAFDSLLIQDTNREQFIQKYLRKNIMRNFAVDIVQRYEKI